ncbi:hypothetical protein GCM10027575_49400 [Phytohabitans suffuscus]
MLLLDGKSHPAIIDMLNSGRSTCRPTSGPQPIPVGAAQACVPGRVYEVGVLDGKAADEVRHDLIAARDAVSRQDASPSQLALGLTVLRFHEPASPVTAPVVRAVATKRPDPAMASFWQDAYSSPGRLN